MPQGISVIIPAYNEERTIRDTLEGVLDQDYDKYQVTVVDDGSTDSTKEIVEEFDEVELLENEKNQGLAGSLNKGMENAEYDILCTLHADCVPKDEDWLEQMHSCLTEDTAVVACRHAISEERFQRFNMVQKLLSIGVREGEMDAQDGCEEAEGFDGKGDLYRKEAMEEIGGFGSEKFFRAGEDGHIKIKLQNQGWNFRSAPTYIYHNHGSNQETFRDFFRKKLEYSEAFGANRRIHGKDKPMGLWNEATKSLLYLSLLIPYLNLATIPLIIFKLLYQTWRNRGQEFGLKILLLPFIIFLGDIMSIIGFWKGYLTGKQTL
ncbi:MAG: glycosyltransferase family 2 protein [Candidatus Nanohalobium sp.]